MSFSIFFAWRLRVPFKPVEKMRCRNSVSRPMPAQLRPDPNQQSLSQWGSGRTDQNMAENTQAEIQHRVRSVWQFPVDHQIVFIIDILVIPGIVGKLQFFRPLKRLCSLTTDFTFFFL